MKKLSALVALCAVLLSVSCATMPPMPTPSGQAEITVPQSRAVDTRAKITNVVVNQGFLLKSRQEGVTLFEGREVNPFLNGMNNMTVKSILRLTEVPSGGQVRFIAEMGFNTKNRFGLDTDQPLKSGHPDMLQMQKLLESCR